MGISICQYCKKEFEYKRKRDKYCSKECSRNKLKYSRIEEKNPFWKNDRSVTYYMRLAKDNLIRRCHFCGDDDNLCVHHIDMNRDNNKINNLVVVCKSCHTKLHNLGV